MKMLIPQFALDIWNWFPPLTQYLIETTFWILVVMITVILSVAFTTYFERKVRAASKKAPPRARRAMGII